MPAHAELDHVNLAADDFTPSQPRIKIAPAEIRRPLEDDNSAHEWLGPVFLDGAAARRPESESSGIGDRALALVFGAGTPVRPHCFDRLRQLCRHPCGNFIPASPHKSGPVECQARAEIRIGAHEARVVRIEERQQFYLVPARPKLLRNLVGNNASRATTAEHIRPARLALENRSYVGGGFFSNTVVRMVG